MDANEGSRKATLLVFVVFVLGIALGSLGTYLVTSRVQAAHVQPTLARDPSGVVARFTHDLDLNTEQQKEIQAIFNDTRSKYAALHQRLDPEYEQVRQQGRDKIRAILTQEQQPKLEELLRQIDEDRRRRQASGAHD